MFTSILDTRNPPATYGLTILTTVQSSMDWSMMTRSSLRYLSLIAVLSSDLLTSEAVRFKCGNKKLSGPLSVGSYKDYLSEICQDLSVTGRER